jgi:cytochrome c oxidase assembly factor CtaG
MVFFGIGGLLVFIGTIWLVVLAIQTGKSTGEKVIWAVVNFLCQPIGGIVFVIVTKQGVIPLVLILIGLLCYGGGILTDREVLKMLR